METIELTPLADFDPTREKLETILAESQHLVISSINLEDKAQLETVKRARLNLRTARVQIEKTGKAMRDGANAYAKAVIAREKELIGIIEPEEDRLADIEKQAAELAEKKLREAQLPERRARLEGAGLAPISDEILLTMTSIQFETNVNQLIAEKNEAEAKARQAEQDAKQAELEAKEAEIKERERALEEESRAKEREEKARQEERERIEREAKEKEEREAKAEEARKKEEAEQTAKRERADRYKAFRASHGWTEETTNDFYEKVDDANTKVTLYKKVGEFDLSLI